MSSVSTRQKPNGSWEVRWREPDGRRRGRTLTRRRDAERFAAQVRRTLELGGLVQLDEDLPTLAEWVETWWQLHALPNLAANTRATYARVWDKHLRPRIGELRLRAITPAVIELQVVEPMPRADVGVPTIRMALAVLQSVMRLAVVHHDALATNPVALVRRPKTPRRDTVPVWPTMVEAIRARFRHRDATIVAVLAYAGLRPEELLALQWRDVRAEVLVIERAVTHGELRRTKTGQDREVRLLAPLAQDLAEWRLASGRPRDLRALVFPPHRRRGVARHRLAQLAGARLPARRARRRRLGHPAVRAARVVREPAHPGGPDRR
jgi:integrase